MYVNYISTKLEKIKNDRCHLVKKWLHWYYWGNAVISNSKADSKRISGVKNSISRVKKMKELSNQGELFTGICNSQRSERVAVENDSMGKWKNLKK